MPKSAKSLETKHYRCNNSFCWTNLTYPFLRYETALNHHRSRKCEDTSLKMYCVNVLDDWFQFITINELCQTCTHSVVNSTLRHYSLLLHTHCNGRQPRRSGSYEQQWNFCSELHFLTLDTSLPVMLNLVKNKQKYYRKYMNLPL